MISPVTMKPNGAMTFSSGARYGRPRSGSLLRSDTAWAERAGEAHLQQQVDRRTQEHGADHRDRHVPLGVACLPGELGGLLEAFQGEHDAERNRDEHALEA